MPTTTRSGTTGGDRIDEVLEAMRDLIRILDAASGPPIASSTGVGSDQQRALFAYQWIASHLGRTDVSAPPVVTARRQKGALLLLDDPYGATHAFVVSADGSVEEVALSEDSPRSVPLAMRDDVPIVYVELRSDGMPIAIVHPLASL
jgi:hypothetical protein